MLSRREQELLTAYVDGELSARQRRQVDRLLRRNGEARAFLAQLQGDSLQLRSAPAVCIPLDLSDPILELIAQRGLRPGKAPAETPPQRRAGPKVKENASPSPVPRVVTFPLWWGAVAAAAVLVVISSASFFAHRASAPSREGDMANGALGNKSQQAQVPDEDEEPDRTDREVAKQTRQQQRSTITRNQGGETRPTPGGTPGRDPQPPDGPKPDDKGQPSTTPKPNKEPTNSPPELPDEPVLTSGDREAPGKLERVEIALPALLDIHKLDQPVQSDRLRKELNQAGALRVEILARDATRGFERVRAALAERKITLHLDPVAQIRLKKPLWRTDYAVFVENLKTDEVLSLLLAAGLADRQAGEKKAAEQRFDGTLVVKPFSRWDVKELVELLGIDPVTQRPTPPVPQKIDITKPLSETTQSQVVAALEGKGVPRPRTLEQAAYATVLSGPRSRPVELKRYLDSRGPAIKETRQILLIVRNVGS